MVKIICPTDSNQFPTEFCSGTVNPLAIIKPTTADNAEYSYGSREVSHLAKSLKGDSPYS